MSSSQMTAAVLFSKPRATVPSKALLAMGRKVAHTYADAPMTATQIEKVARAYAQLSLTPRTLVHETRSSDGHPLLIVVFDTLLWAVDHGVPWCFQLPGEGPSLRSLLSDSAHFVTLYERHLAGEIQLTPSPENWLLTSFSTQAQGMARRWMNEDVRCAFELAKVPQKVNLFGNFDRPHDQLALKIRMLEGRPKNMRYILRIIGSALRPIREALDRDVRRTLWSIRVYDGRVAHWLLTAPCDRTRLWRTQALRAHRVLVPWLLQQSVSSSSQGSLFGSVAASFTAQVDAGQPFLDDLAKGLTRVTGEQWSQDHVRFLPTRCKGISLAQANRDHKGTLWQLVDACRHLSPMRTFTHVTHFGHMASLLKVLRHWEVMPAAHRMETFFKGCPTNWSDPFYDSINNHLSLICDAMNLVRPVAARKVIFATLNYRQILNLADRLHQSQEQFMASIQEEQLAADENINVSLKHQYKRREEVCHWAPAGELSPWSHQGHEVHELLSLEDTKDEGHRMRHCVGNGRYAQTAALGNCRLFSIRNINKNMRPVSTFELSWDRHRGRLVVAQHFGPRDRPPSPVAQATLQAWLKARRCQCGPWTANQDMRQVEQRIADLEQYLDTNGNQARQRLHQHIFTEIQRRFPQMTLPTEETEYIRDYNWYTYF